MAVSLIRQNFQEDSENGINRQINLKLYTSYVYLSMAYYFDRDDVALHGISEYFKKSSDNKKGQAQMFMKYLNKRGGSIILSDIKQPQTNDWIDAEEAFSAALQLEKDSNTTLLSLHQISSVHNDANLCDFLESKFLQAQVDTIKSIGDLLTNITRVGKKGLGIFIFDKELKS